MDFGMRSMTKKNMDLLNRGDSNIGRNNDRNWLVVIFGIMLIKIILMGFFSSDYQNGMFRPFVNTFLDGNNPYSYYYENGLSSAFPYFPMMLFCESFGEGIIRLFSVHDLFCINIIFKLPLLIFDLIGLFMLRKMNISYKYIVVFYLCSPIILYSTYMHGQLDIIPTVLLITAIYHLLYNRSKTALFWYAFFLGLSLSTKLHILAAAPILFFYVTKKKGYLKALIYHLVTVGIVFIISTPFYSRGFVETVIFNKEQRILLNVYVDYVSTRLLLPVFVLLLLYFYVFQLRYINQNLLISSLNLLFAVFLICIPAMPAWFVWIVPFITLYFGFVEIRKHTVMIVYLIFMIIYVVYYVFLHQTEYTDLYFLNESLQFCKINLPSIRYVVFTIMASSLAILIYEIYRFGVASNALYQRGKKAFAIGIAGNSGTGKSSLLSTIKKLFDSPKDILVVEGDGDHRWSRGDENWSEYTALNPRANYLYRQAEDIRKLKEGIYVNRHDYDHVKGTFTEKRRFNPTKFLLISGLHSLYLPQLRDVLDLKIFMDTDESLRRYWKIHRDSEERGYSVEDVLRQIEERSEDGRKFINPQKEYADIVMRYYSSNTDMKKLKKEDINVSITLSVDVDMEPLISAFEDYDVKIQWNLCEEFTKQEIVVEGSCVNNRTLPYWNIAEAVIPQYEDILVGEPKWIDGIDGIIQCVLLYVISTKMRSIS